MSEQPLDLKRSIQIVRRHWIAVGIIVLIGISVGAGLTVIKPPMLTSTSFVVLPPSGNIPTEVVIASSDKVLARALPDVNPTMSLQALMTRIRVERVAQSDVVSIRALGKTADQAVDTANAVANSFVAYLGSRNDSVGKVSAQVLAPATTATRTSLPIRVLEGGGIGLLLGAVVGVIGALALSRRDRRLRERDDIADAIGVPVLASLRVQHPADPASWARLLHEHEPSAVHLWQVRNALDLLGLTHIPARVPGRDDQGYSLTVLSLSSDRRALALGPHMAIASASQGIPTALVVGPQQDSNVTANLRAACSGAPQPPRQSRQLTLEVADRHNLVRPPDALLTVVVAVVDGGNPRLAGTIRTEATILGVSAGAVTAEQLARVAASLAADGRKLCGIVVADPDPSDRTTGRNPRVARLARRARPMRLTA